MEEKKREKERESKKGSIPLTGDQVYVEFLHTFAKRLELGIL